MTTPSPVTPNFGLPCVAVAVSLCACAAQPRAALNYEADHARARCPRAITLRHSVAELLGYDPWVAKSPRRISARVIVDGDHLLGQVRFRDEAAGKQGTRDFEAPPTECAELVTSMALAISLAIDPIAVESERKRQRRSDWSGTLSVGAGTVVGAVPAPTFAARLGLSLRRRWFSAAVEGQLAAPPATVSPLPGVDIASWRATGATLFCAHWRWARLCPLFALSGLLVSQKGLQDGHDEALLVPAVGLRLGSGFRVARRFSIDLQADLNLPLTRAVLRDDLATTEFWSAPAVYGLFTVGLQWHLFFSGRNRQPGSSW